MKTTEGLSSHYSSRESSRSADTNQGECRLKRNGGSRQQISALRAADCLPRYSACPWPRKSILVNTIACLCHFTQQLGLASTLSPVVGSSPQSRAPASPFHRTARTWFRAAWNRRNSARLGTRRAPKGHPTADRGGAQTLSLLCLVLPGKLPFGF
jgi:hypothetical protein